MARLEGLFPRVKRQNQRVNNALPRQIQEAGVDEQLPYDNKSFNLYDKDRTPYKIRRTVKNCRFAATDPFVRGILLDTVTKVNSQYEIVGDNPKAVEHIKEMAKEWGLSQDIDETIEKGLVDGTAYIYTWWEEGHLKYRYLLYDQEDYQIKEIYDDNGEIMGYKQRILKNENTNCGWRKTRLQDLWEDQDYYEENFEVDEIVPVKFNPKDGTGRGLIVNILDLVYYRRTLINLMPTTVYKNSNIFKVIIGNSDNPGQRLGEDDRKRIVDAANDYHKKGAIVFPWGVDGEVLQGGSLPDIPGYLKYLEKIIYIGMNTPEATFSSESSNRATADIQLDSPTTGRVLFLDYIRDWINSIFADNIFRRELDENGFKGSNVWLEFKIDITEELDEGEEGDGDSGSNDSVSGKKPIQKKGEDYNTRDSVKKQNTSNLEKIGGQIGGNGSTK